MDTIKWIRQGQVWADYYWNTHGLSVLPIARDSKRPLCSTNRFKDHIPPDVFKSFGTGNMAIRCGSLNRIIALDVDNREKAKDWFMQHPPLPKTWASRSGSGGLHLWFKVPDWWGGSTKSCQLWKGTEKHEEVALKGDGTQVICPPSIITVGNVAKAYKWEAGFAPMQTRLSNAPAWLLKQIADTNAPPALPPLSVSDDPYVLPVGRVQGVIFDQSVIDRVPNKLQLLIGWGLRLARDSPNASGWYACYRPGEQDQHASASVRADSGSVWIAGRGVMNFFEVAVTLGIYPDVQTAVKKLSEEFR